MLQLFQLEKKCFLPLQTKTSKITKTATLFIVNLKARENELYI